MVVHPIGASDVAARREGAFPIAKTCSFIIGTSSHVWRSLDEEQWKGSNLTSILGQ